MVIPCYFQFHKSDKLVLRNNCLHYFVQKKEKTDVTFAIPITEHFEDVNGIPFNLPIGELALMATVHR